MAEKRQCGERALSGRLRGPAQVVWVKRKTGSGRQGEGTACSLEVCDWLFIEGNDAEDRKDVGFGGRMKRRITETQNMNIVQGVLSLKHLQGIRVQVLPIIVRRAGKIHLGLCRGGNDIWFSQSSSVNCLQSASAFSVRPLHWKQIYSSCSVRICCVDNDWSRLFNNFETMSVFHLSVFSIISIS